MPEDVLGYAKPFKSRLIIKGRLTRSTIEEISRAKKEPDWMRRLRLRALELFEKLPTPNWVIGVDEIDLEELAYYVKPDLGSPVSSFDELPPDIREYYEKLGIPEMEAKLLAGLNLQFESETVYHKAKEMLEKKGVIMMPMDEAVKKYPDLVKEYFSKVFPAADHKFSALHYALWSGGAFVYVPKGARIVEPIEAFFLIGQSLEGQFEHTLVVADEDSYIHFIEGCSAPMLKRYSFHDGAVELYAHRNSTIKFTTIQNWSKNVINFNNKRGITEEGAHIEWIEGSLGSKITYTYPSTILKGANSSSSSIVIQLAKGNYIKDSGSKMYHLAPNTRSRIVNKSISVDGGVNIYRGLVKIARGALNARSHVECQSLILDDHSLAYTYPHNQVDEPTAVVT
ncbi:MAG: Fe-S cluster assembly protein SufB, partial [Desulfurococcales archaeon]|nr:Fe-S cluster assembly protein SufB [Desulfurococcales archaeon]